MHELRQFIVAREGQGDEMKNGWASRSTPAIEGERVPVPTPNTRMRLDSPRND